ncbi:hypothetical protein B0A48_06753 [Cryoendolithus antarcticus]|uniref:Bacterial surface antigen (D15) domain-containing protein n=1 Tax=Cryoendolithus antarcticus TaxID=1507870 RepID=A0A1V8T9M9_9PEZI|nr:hypothetical protein B0A48_06753 [Cryoendolithus antarcticus]
MAEGTPSGASGLDIFAALRTPIDPTVLAQRAQDLDRRLQHLAETSQTRQTELLAQNASKPITISSVQVLGAPHTRRGFLERIFEPVLARNGDGDYTLQEALGEMGSAVRRLEKLDVFTPPISIYIDTAEPTSPSTTPTDHAVFISARERGRYTIKTGTEAGSSEGSAYLNVILRNLFGGAESLNVNGSLGTRTRSAYSAVFSSPVLSDPDLQVQIGGVASSTLKPWASHEEVLKGGDIKLLWRDAVGARNELGYRGFWRQVTGLAENASGSVRGDAGDSFKSSIAHTWTRDTRDVPMMPSRGTLLKTVTEVAGLGPLAGDVAFGKVELESQAAVPVPLPGVEGDSGVSFTAGLRGGVLYPLMLGGQSGPAHSRINDRFQLGGPTDVRGFRLSGLGPRDGNDALGGDVYAAGGASLLFPLPHWGKETPLRFQAFINGGRLLALKDSRRDKEGVVSPREVSSSVSETLRELGNGLPSAAAGVGLVYAHPAARFEVNFSLPLVIRKGEEGRKGFSFGVGLSFL